MRNIHHQAEKPQRHRDTELKKGPPEGRAQGTLIGLVRLVAMRMIVVAVVVLVVVLLVLFLVLLVLIFGITVVLFVVSAILDVPAIV